MCTMVYCNFAVCLCTLEGQLSQSDNDIMRYAIELVPVIDLLCRAGHVTLGCSVPGFKIGGMCGLLMLAGDGCSWTRCPCRC